MNHMQTFAASADAAWPDHYGGHRAVNPMSYFKTRMSTPRKMMSDCTLCTMMASHALR